MSFPLGHCGLPYFWDKLTDILLLSNLKQGAWRQQHRCEVSPCLWEVCSATQGKHHRSSVKGRQDWGLSSLKAASSRAALSSAAGPSNCISQALYIAIVGSLQSESRQRPWGEGANLTPPTSDLDPGHGRGRKKRRPAAKACQPPAMVKTDWPALQLLLFPTPPAQTASCRLPT